MNIYVRLQLIEGINVHKVKINRSNKQNVQGMSLTTLKTRRQIDLFLVILCYAGKTINK